MEAVAIETRVAGVSYRQLQLLGLREGSLVSLKREPYNEYDSNAIAVLRFFTRIKIGYIPRDLAVDLAPRIDKGSKVSAAVIRLTGDTSSKPTQGVIIEVVID